MITFETGIPGSGKTLYCVDKLLRPLIGATIEVDGRTISRTIYSNINGLTLQHERIEGGPEWVWEPKKDHPKGGEWKQDPQGNKLGLNNWHEWAKPGDIIVFDEVQAVWPKQVVGSRVPPCIQQLEVHRHKGVDFILLTQKPELVHTNVTGLVGRHLHLRRLGNMGLATVYEWDGCSRSLNYKAAMSKSAFRYSKDVFQLYKSAEVHTKMPRKMPALLYGVAFGIIGLLFLGPTVASRLSDRMNPEAAKAAASAPGAPASAPVTATRLAASTTPQGAPVVPTPPPPPAPVFAGCMRAGEQCRCLDAAGALVAVERAQCLSVSGFGRGPAIDIGSDTPVPVVDVAQLAADVDVHKFMRSKR